MSELPDPPLPALTREEFEAGAGHTFHGVSIVEDETGSYIYAYGHVHKGTMVAAVAAYDAENDPGSEPHTVDDVTHVRAVTTKPVDGPDGWYITWPQHVTAATPGSFPVTVVNR